MSRYNAEPSQWEPVPAVEIVLDVIRANNNLFHASQLRELAKRIVSASGLISRDEHLDAVVAEVRWLYRESDRAERAEREVFRLHRMSNLGSTKRAAAVADLVRSDNLHLRVSQTAKHDDDCWRRHAPCLAARISDMMADPQYDPVPEEQR